MLSGGAIRSPHLVAGRLAEDAETAVSDDEMRMVLECVREMLFGPNARIEILDLIEAQAQLILAAGHSARTAEVRRDAGTLINLLGERGFIQFGDLLRGT